MTTPKEVTRLVERFGENREAYLSREYNETQLRREFLDPFFKALGWDVDNEQGYAEAYKDVVHEDAIKVGGATKAPDYAFRIGGTRKFFVEAKRPSVGIKDDPNAAYQLRRYAWSAKLPLSILTDFEEFAVYDCRVRPNKDDKASTARTLYFTYDEYESKWDEIAGIFARDAILKGSFDKYVEAKKKRGTAEVDDAFLKEIEGWRDVLARNIALRNTGLSNREVNFAVQRTIDRIIFLRICEDRGIEMYRQLMALRNGHDVYRRLCEVFRNADDRYNSGLFHFRKEKGRGEVPDELTLGLQIDDKVLKDVFKDLYYPDSPYEFSVLPADILGHIYEQFLGKVIRLTPAHRAVVEEKPEVRKAGGVYYTPTYIVDYIVEHTVGKLLEDKTPNQAAKLRVLDPACGSGSFLLGAYQRLLDWHLVWYSENDPAKHAKGRNPRIYRAMTPSPLAEEGPSPSSSSAGTAPSSPSGKGHLSPSPSGRGPFSPSPPGRGQGEGTWRLTTAEKKRILLNNIYGVDIDPQAVEVTKLSLLLKVLEGESEETLGKTLRMFHERALPDLGENIKCGNSLIGPDFYEGKQLSLIDEEERYRINAFDWHAEFPHIFPSPPGRGQGEGGGFDAVIGNPPYIRIQAMKEWAPIEVEFYKQRYTAASKGNYDIYVVFVERALQLLNKSGRMGFILPHKFFQAKYGEPLRGLIAGGRHVGEVVHFGAHQIFTGATTYTCLLFLHKDGRSDFQYVKIDDLDSWRTEGRAVTGCIAADRLTKDEWNLVAGREAALFDRLCGCPQKLGDVADIFVGIQTSADAVFIMDLVEETEQALVLKSKALDGEWSFEKDLVFPLVSGTDVQRYGPLPKRQYVLFPYLVDGDIASLLDFGVLSKRYPETANYLLKNRQVLEARENGRGKGAEWYGYIYRKNLARQSVKKICVPRLVDALRAAYDPAGDHFLDNVDVGGVAPKRAHNEEGYLFLLGLLNSSLLRWFFPFVSVPFRGGWLSANRQFLSQLPVRTIDFSDPVDKARHDRMVSLVHTMLDLHNQLATRTEHERTTLQRQIDATDKQIDQLVYELYGLTDKEIRIVEEAISSGK